ncbi:MAG: hypothetical protein KFH87_00780, partial [Bacteroidetes bacterium]|nr:hypothetical protein [Bacteroidota bacterium]
MTPFRILLFGLFLLLGSMLLVSCGDDALPVDPGNDTHIRDTTSHDFVWSFDTVAAPFSAINSIAVISPDNLWVTGQFFPYDSLGRPYGTPVGNVAHWNGREWTFHGFNSSGLQSWHEMHDAFARNADNIWVSGGGPFQWDGARWITHWYDGFRFGSGVRATWVTEDARFACVVGLRRSIAYYRADDPHFRQVHIPFDEDCLDVKGTEDGTMYVAGASLDPYGGHIYRVHPDRSVEVYC